MDGVDLNTTLFCSISPDVAICMSGFEVDLNLPAGQGVIIGDSQLVAISESNLIRIYGC